MKKKTKAWAMIDEIEKYPLGFYYTRKEAVRVREFLNEYKIKDAKVIRCEITYSIPSKGKKK